MVCDHFRGYQVNGETAVITTIRRPYDLIEPFYAEFPGVLAIAAGKPPHNPLTDFSRAKVGVIPDRLLDADPRAALDELRMLEDQPAQGTAHNAAAAVRRRPGR